MYCMYGMLQVPVQNPMWKTVFLTNLSMVLTESICACRLFWFVKLARRSEPELQSSHNLAISLVNQGLRSQSVSCRRSDKALYKYCVSHSGFGITNTRGVALDEGLQTWHTAKNVQPPLSDLSFTILSAVTGSSVSVERTGLDSIIVVRSWLCGQSCIRQINILRLSIQQPIKRLLQRRSAASDHAGSFQRAGDFQFHDRLRTSHDRGVDCPEPELSCHINGFELSCHVKVEKKGTDGWV